MIRRRTGAMVVLAISGTIFSFHFAGCAAGNPSDGSPASDVVDSGSSTDSSISSTDASEDGGIDFDSNFDAACVPSTCAALDANCGAVTDPKCGGVVDCGACTMGLTCGGGGVHNQCGMGAADACVPNTCAAQGINCGPAGDGCGGLLACGTCSAPQSCGGDPSKPGQCGCTGTCSKVPTCTGGTTTTITGKVLDPAGARPLNNALVYIPNNPSDPGLAPFAAGISCDVCGATAAGSPLVTAYTAPDGTFTLKNAPVGSSIPLVVQLGRWRRQFTINVANKCGANPLPAGMLTMPKNHTEGDIPRIALLTGGLDPIECVLRKMGVDDSEFTNPGKGGHINFYKADHTACLTDTIYPGWPGSGAVIDTATPNQAALFAVSGTTPVINQYDMVYLECTGCAETESASHQAALHAYAEAGGRVFASDWMSTFLDQNGNFANAAKWNTHGSMGGTPTGPYTIDLVSNPAGKAFDAWLEIVGVSVKGSDQIATITPAFHNTTGVVAPTQQWLSWGSSATPLHFSFNVPIGAPPASQCGRVVFSDWHSNGNEHSHNTTFPAACDSQPMSPQEAILEFMLFDLSACVPPLGGPICKPTTCSAQGIQCGPAGDGCGNLLDCGTCPAGQYCGGGGPSKCGSSTKCAPDTCASKNVQCGPTGDGCGNTLDCGTCPTGQVCGLDTPGQCGKLK